GSYTWAANGITYSASGTYLDTLTSIAGCDSVVTLQLTIVSSLVLTTTASDTVVCAGTTVNIGVTTNAAADSSGSAFIMKVRTTNPGTSNNDQFQLTGAEGEYNIVATHIASGNIETFNNLTGQQTLTFSNGTGDYLVKVFPTGSVPLHRIQFNNTGDRSKLLEISNWGTIAWSSFAFAFYGCSNLTLNTADAPNLNSVTDLSSMFRNAAQFDQYIGDWDVSSITSLHFTFAGASLFNQALGTWDVSSVTNFGKTFGNATSFNQDLSNWDVSSATNMGYMFDGATSFNQGIGTWDVSDVTYMSFMFQNATIFNQNLSGWCVSNFSTAPSNFSTSSALTISNHPVWGTCP
ncbi:MAG: BspA family leucine-rich repeat surface protein, partial [Salibacteraceae bacterium]|nr:BspA family leucine-rich repeat surface protein [Salibacteraceae bacterium]